MSINDTTLIKAEKGIILAADVPTLEELRRLVQIASEFPEVVALKLGFALGLRYGLGEAVAIVKQGSRLPVIYDHQKAGTDIPQMGKLFAEVCRDAGACALIFFPQAGPKTLEGFVSASFQFGLTPIVGLVMTHEAYLRSEGGYIVDEAPEMMAKTAISLGVRNFVLPGTKAACVKKFASGVLADVEASGIMMPGIGSQGGSLAAAFRAAKPHRRFAIIGSAVYAAKEPKLALERFIKEMQYE